MLANYHTHTTRCKHAHGTEREYIEQAIKCGFKTLGFSEHVPFPDSYGFNPNMRMSISELPDYTSTLVKLREEYKNDIEILIGYEVEYTPSHFEEVLKTLKQFPYDYIIQGQHFVEGNNSSDYAGDPTDSLEYFDDYVETTIEGMRTGEFMYLAHPDLIKFTGDAEIFKEKIRPIIKEAAELDIPLEVNMYGFSDHRNYPNDNFWSMVPEYGAKVTLGCDAHGPEMIIQPKDVPGLREFIEKNGLMDLLIQPF